MANRYSDCRRGKKRDEGKRRWAGLSKRKIRAGSSRLEWKVYSRKALTNSLRRRHDQFQSNRVSFQRFCGWVFDSFVAGDAGLMSVSASAN